MSPNSHWAEYENFHLNLAQTQIHSLKLDPNDNDFQQPFTQTRPK